MRLFLLLVSCFVVSTAQAQSPNDVVEEAISALAESLDGRKDELAEDKAALYAMIDELLLPRFDRKYAAQLVLGRHWRDADDEQRERFIDAFYNTLVQRYADGLLKFNQDRIEVLAYRGDDSKPRTIVRTIVELDDGTKVPVNYGLVRRDSGWMMFDVTIEGISYVRNFRAEINSEIQTSNLDAVISRYESEAGAVNSAE